MILEQIPDMEIYIDDIACTYFFLHMVSITANKGGEWKLLELFSLHREKVEFDLLNNPDQSQIRKKTALT